MKICLDVDDKYEGLLNKLNESQKQRLMKGLSAHASAVMATLQNTPENMLDTTLKVLTSAMFLLHSITGEAYNDDEEDAENT